MVISCSKAITIEQKKLFLPLWVNRNMNSETKFIQSKPTPKTYQTTMKNNSSKAIAAFIFSLTIASTLSAQANPTTKPSTTPKPAAQPKPSTPKPAPNSSKPLGTFTTTKVEQSYKPVTVQAESSGSVNQ
jgi:hypothetical protein